MTEESPQKNTVATVGMRFSIIWLIALISLFLAWFSFPLLFIWFVLWIIGLFYKPRWRAWIAVSIPLIVFIAIASIVCYVWSSIKTPTKEFIGWAETNLEQLETDESFDNEAFGKLVKNEINNIVNDKTEDDWKDLFGASTGSNAIEKGSYLMFSIIQQWFENALEKYNNGELSTLTTDENDNKIVDIDIEDIKDDEDDKSEKQEEIIIEEPKKENNGTFSKNEQNDIEQFLNILE